MSPPIGFLARKISKYQSVVAFTTRNTDKPVKQSDIQKCKGGVLESTDGSGEKKGVSAVAKMKMKMKTAPGSPTNLAISVKLSWL